MSQKIRIKLKAYDHNLVDKSAEKIVKTVKGTGAVVSGPIPLPTQKKIFTVNRSTFVNKKAREQFELSTCKRILDIYSSTPKTIDALMKLVGAQPVDWGFKTECCGAGFSVSRTDIVGRLSGEIVRDAADRGAQAIIVACPMCHSNLDMRRQAIDSYLRRRIDVPVLYVTQAIGLAVGLSPRELGIERHFVPVTF